MKTIANLICLDSAPELPNLLESLKGKIDGLVAVDGGSTDNTVEILSTWGKETGTPVLVKHNKWPDDFGLQRNLCLNVTRAEYGIASKENDIWILMIDTDDTLEKFNREILEKCCGGNEAVSGLQCKMDNHNGFFFVCQFFRLTSGAMWRNPIHEYIEVESGQQGMPPNDTILIKRGHSRQHANDRDRNVRIGRRFVESDPTNSRARFYLARDILECPVVPLAQRLAEAEGNLRVYLSLKTNFITQDRYALLLLVRLLADTERVAEARTLLLDWIRKDPNNRAAYESLSRLSTDENEKKVWVRLSAAADGSCVLPYANKLPGV